MAKRTKSQSGALSRRKGASFERSVVKALQDAGIACRRNTGQAGSAPEECMRAAEAAIRAHARRLLELVGEEP